GVEGEAGEIESDDPGLRECLAGREPVRAAVRAVLAAIPEEQPVEDLIALVAAADLDGVVTERGEEILRLPREVAALERVLVDGPLGAVAGGTVGPAGCGGIQAPPPPLHGSEAPPVA